MRHTSTKSSGFTIVELIIVMVVAGILLPLLIGPLDGLYTSFTQGTKSIVQTADVHNAMRILEDEVTYAVNFNSTLAAVSPLGMNNDATTWDWRGTDADHRVLILTAYATTAVRNGDTSGSRLLAFASNCTTPLTNTYIYFVKNSTLYRRTIKSPSAACSSTPVAQKTSCAAGGGCDGVDAVITTDVTKFSVDYYLNSSAPTPLAGEYDDGSTVPSTAQTVVITVTTSKGSGQYKTESSRTLRVTRLNGVTA